MKRIAVLAVAALIAFGLIGCSSSGDLNKSDSGDDIYEGKEVNINGLPCIIVRSGTYGGHTVVSIDCDWSVRHGSTTTTTSPEDPYGN